MTSGVFSCRRFFKRLFRLDDATVEVVQIGSRETATFQWHERTEIRWDDWEHFHDHPFRTALGAVETLRQLEAFGQFLAHLLGAGAGHGFLQLDDQFGQVDAGQQFLHGFGTHSGHETFFAILLFRFTEFDFR